MLALSQSEGIWFRVTEDEKRSSNIGDKIKELSFRNLFEMESGPDAEFVFRFEIILTMPFKEKEMAGIDGEEERGGVGKFKLDSLVKTEEKKELKRSAFSCSDETVTELWESEGTETESRRRNFM